MVVRYVGKEAALNEKNTAWASSQEESMQVMGGGREIGCHVPLRKTVVYLAWYKISL